MTVKPMFYDPKLKTETLVIHYAIGGQEREASVLATGHSLEEHIGRLEALSESPLDSITYVTWPLVAGGAIAIRIESIIAIEAPEWIA
ncbi:hypothetical protein [Streptomyces sp. NPDC057966]|uniref:hypothetical protein n=1 Tax=Streptomyces sp. NPDC057966 TaxID=3346292 RepID=UPI0036E8A6CD